MKQQLLSTVSALACSALMVTATPTIALAAMVEQTAVQPGTPTTATQTPATQAAATTEPATIFPPVTIYTISQLRSLPVWNDSRYASEDFKAWLFSEVHERMRNPAASVISNSNWYYIRIASGEERREYELAHPEPEYEKFKAPSVADTIVSNPMGKKSVGLPKEGYSKSANLITQGTLGMLTLDASGNVRNAKGEMVARYNASTKKFTAVGAKLSRQDLSTLLVLLDRKPEKDTKAVNTASAPTITISLPAEGKNDLANGYTVDASGVIKDPSGNVVGKVTDSGKLTDAGGKPLDAASSRRLTDLFKFQQPSDSDYARCEAVIQNNNCGGYAEVAKGTDQVPMIAPPAPAIAQIPANDRYVQKNAYVAATDKGEVVRQKADNLVINNFIQGNLDKPDKIAEAMRRHNLDLKRIQLATGYSRQQMIDYVNASKSRELKEILIESTDF